MLKKLVRYGNSNALIFDKAILELLNISEGAVVKIKTDGTSLIITPVLKQKHEEEVSKTITPEEEIGNASLRQTLNIHLAQKNLSPETKELIVQELNMLLSKRTRTLHASPHFKSFSQVLQYLFKKYKGTVDVNYQQEYTFARDALIPELKELDESFADFEKKYDLQLSPRDKVATEPSMALRAALAEVFKKYAGVIEKLNQVAENPEFLHELQILAEKHNLDKNSREFLEAIEKLKYKYVPEAEAMDKEMAAIAQQENK